jgi:hypothetical protein
MDVLNARVALRERGLLDVLDLALRFVTANASIYARLTLFVVAPIAALVTWGVMSLDPALAWALVIVASHFVQLPFIALAGRLVFEREVRLRDVLRDTLRVLPRAFGMRFLQIAGIVGAGFIACVPGFYLAAAWVFAPEVLVLEGSGPAATLGRARRMVTRQLGTAVAAFAVLSALHALATWLFDDAGRIVLGELLQVTAPDPVFTLRPLHVAAPTILASIGFWLFVPFGATARFLVYIDLRTRSEAWDVQTRFAAVAARLAGAQS